MVHIFNYSQGMILVHGKKKCLNKINRAIKQTNLTVEK